MISALCPLSVLLLGSLLCPGRGNVPGDQKEIFTRPGSDLLLPVRVRLTLRSWTPTEGCDGIEWKYKKSPRANLTRIFLHRACNLITDNVKSNMEISENGSLRIHHVTPDNDGIYNVTTYNSTGRLIQTAEYIVHVEVPVSDPVLNVSCLLNGSAEISCMVETGTNPDIRLSVIEGSEGNYTASNRITAIVGSPGPWNITCSVKNRVSQSETSKAGVTCPDLQPGRGHLLSLGAVCVFCTAILICVVIGWRKKKNERNRSERRRMDRTEREMEPTYKHK